MIVNNSSKPLKRLDERIIFKKSDFEIMDIALDHIQELRLCAGIVREARKSKISYPLKSNEPLHRLLKDKSIFIEGHHISAQSIDRYMRSEYFPIENERDLISRCFLAFMACKADINWAAQAPDYADELLKEYYAISRRRRKP